MIDGHMPGKEIPYPVATVIVGGLITSTICIFLLRPGMFWHFQPADLLAGQESKETSDSKVQNSTESIFHFFLL